MKGRISVLIILSLVMFSCNPKVQTIEYGKDGCHFCSMTIVDRQHAAQLVTKKGKTFKFDAVECMVNHLKKVDTNTIKLFLVNDYNNPGALIDATRASYLISKGIPSPMGAFLTAFKTNKALEKAKTEHGGDNYSWKSLQNHFNN